jgi:hypothetical protein
MRIELLCDQGLNISETSMHCLKYFKKMEELWHLVKTTHWLIT